MKAVSVWNPWAYLLAHGIKIYESRGWSAPPSIIGQRIGICSTKTWKPDQRQAIADPMFQAAYASLGLAEPETLPRGALLGFATLVDCLPVTMAFTAGLTARELALGWYTPGRFAWEFADFDPLPRPLSVSGAQGIWILPDDVYAQAQAQDRPRAPEARPA